MFAIENISEEERKLFARVLIGSWYLDIYLLSVNEIKTYIYMCPFYIVKQCDILEILSCCCCSPPFHLLKNLH